MIRECRAADSERIHFIINEAAQAYKGVIPDDCWHEPYMSMAELRREMGEMTFFGWEDGDGLLGVMGYQPLEGVTLVRHAYVLPEHQSKGIGTRLLAHLPGMTTGRLWWGPGPRTKGRSGSTSGTASGCGRTVRSCCVATGRYRRGSGRRRWCWVGRCERGVGGGRRS